jgi:hypothetical protein
MLRSPLTPQTNSSRRCDAGITVGHMKIFVHACAAILVTYLGLAEGHAAETPPVHEVKVVRAGGVELHYVEQGTWGADRVRAWVGG